MAVEHINRKGQRYYLHEGKTKTGKPKYFFAMKSEGDLLDFIPEGYEIYENPNAQVFLRKIPAQIITPEEIAIVREGIRKHAKIDAFIVDVKDKHIVVYLCDQNVDAFRGLVGLGAWGSDQMMAKLASSFTYSPMMQFVLVDPQTREFVVERWCFRGSVDDWIPLGQSHSLQDLVKNYGCHLGKESFYDLTPWSRTSSKF
ncbi:MAG: hypothetical protein VKJ46_16960 [Leptolyngbyaceae bacterium]|nr:hypothetical protein [Leptolyngbyaceae bacterium]